MKVIYNTLTETFSDYPTDYDKPVIGLEPHLIVYDVIEEQKPEINDNKYLTKSWIANHTEKTRTLTWQTHEYKAVTVSVSMTSLRLELIDAGLYQIVVAAINGIPDATERLKAQTWWTTAQRVERDHPLVAGIAALAKRTDEEVDSIFSGAKARDNQI